ncbi:holo-[acyl-carrier-protein] synthase [Formicincola oecophyllae]|uniref:Holo-[acyl-carrier-protein] synthase n=2 Tax=Formicincola oecophyllae TaxID=2558361 RepID=A0A4Y6UEI4_9PROT|nr:holo-[acyl-carrier-protein] synthase [Formicincola oecophyllae]
MQIIGTGVDLCQIARMAVVLERHGAAFLKRVFTKGERAHLQALPDHAMAAACAKRWAAKEACVKALGTGFAAGVHPAQVGVARAPGGQPQLVLSGAAQLRAQALAGPTLEPALFLSISDDGDYAMAHVILQAMPSAQLRQAF